MKYAEIIDGVVVNIVEASPEVGEERGLTLIPSESVAGIGWTHADGTYTAPPAPEPAGADIDAERERRIALGFTADIGGGETVPVDTRNAVDFRNLNGLGTGSLSRMVAGNGTTFTFRGSDNVTRDLTPAQMNALAMQALAHVDAHYEAAWALKATSPLPADYADDGYWPA